jgi:iron complex transport system substrate-binding protein
MKQVLVIFWLVAVVFVLTACGEDASSRDSGGAENTKLFEDARGVEVRVPDKAERIVAIHDSNAAAQVLSLGVPLVGMATRNGEFELADRYDVEDIEPVGEYSQPNVEKIAALQPDLIIGDGANGEPYVEPAVVEQLEQIAPTVFIDSFREVEVVMKDFAELLGVEAELEEQQGEYEERVAGLRDTLEPKLDKLTVSVIQFEGEQNIGTFGEGWFPFGEAIEDIGIRRPENQATGEAMETCCISVSPERFPEFDADVVLYYQPPETGHDHTDHPLFQKLDAVQAGQAYEWDDDWWGNTYDSLDIVLDDLNRFLVQNEVDPSVHP